MHSVDKIYSTLESLRLKSGMNFTQVAKKLGVTISAYTRMERGETSVTLERLSQLAKIFGTDLKNLLALVIDTENNGDLQKNQNLNIELKKTVNELEGKILSLTEKNDLLKELVKEKNSIIDFIKKDNRLMAEIQDRTDFLLENVLYDPEEKFYNELPEKYKKLSLMAMPEKYQQLHYKIMNQYYKDGAELLIKTKVVQNMVKNNLLQDPELLIAYNKLTNN